MPVSRAALIEKSESYNGMIFDQIVAPL